MRTEPVGLSRLDCNEELNQAVNYVKNNEISLVKAAQQFLIPRNTIHRYVERKVKAYGCNKIFSPQKESVLKDRILLMWNRGFASLFLTF